MNCDEFLPALETGGFFRRRAARRHAARCSACAQTLAAWRALKHGLTAAPPLTGRQRDLWTSVAQPRQVRPRANYTRGRAALAVAAAVLLAVSWWSLRSYNPRPPEQPATPSQIAQVTVVPISLESIAREVFPLEQRLEQMETELAALSRRAAFADLKRQTETLLQAYRY
jgi:hypothetical protein